MSQNIFLDPVVSSPPTLTPGSIGTGTLTVDKLTHFTIDQEYTAVCTSIDPFTVFNIIGSLDGPVGVAIVGQQFVDQDKKIFLTINQGPILFEVGDTFELTVQQGTDLNQQNLDSYDELPQKNFGQGVIGENKGDHNIRFNEAAQLAFRNIQDLKFESKIAGAEGNLISIEYILGTLLASAQKTIQDIKYEANAPGSAGNDITIEYEQFDPAVAATKQIQDILYTAQTPGSGGNSISVEYIGGGTAGSEIVNVTSNQITVTIEDGVSTADQIKTAVNAHGTASTLVDAASTGTGSEPQFIQAETFLEGGLDAVGDAGNEVVTVISNAIKVKFESGVSTAQQVRDAVAADGSAFALVNPTITGVASTAQTAPVAPTNLTGGADDVGDPGNEIVTVTDKRIQVTFVDGLSTAQQIKDAIEASVSADALVAVTLIGLGQAEVTDLVALAASAITNGESFNVNSENDVRTARFYYRIDSVDSPPGTGDDVPIDILSTDTASQVAVKSAAAINAEPEWTVPVPPGSTFRITNASVGPSTDVSNFDVGNGTSTPFSITKVKDGFAIGQEFQSSPEARTFLAGGLGQGTYAFNTKELTDIPEFFEGNAAIIINNLSNQGDETTSGETIKKGKVTLDDDEPSNGSGPLVDNLQKSINNLIQNGKCLLISDSDARLKWSDPAGTLSVDGDIKFLFTETGVVNTILSTNFPETLADGEHLWVVVDRDNSTDLTLNKGSNVPDSPNGENVFRLVSRIGTSLVWWDNTLQREGKDIRIGEGEANHKNEQPTGTVDGVNADFVLSEFPLSGSLKVFLDGLLDVEFTFDDPSKTITMNVAPELGQDVRAVYKY